LEEILQGKGEIIINDILKVDIKTELSLSKALVVGNLPYYITSPILRKFFNNEHPNILGGLFMIQAEVGEKITVDARKKSYLYRLLNYAYQVNYLKTVPAKAFNPPPKVKSCLVSLIKKTKLPQISFKTLMSFLDAFAPYNRKTLGKITKMIEKRKENSPFFIPEHLAKKRLEELCRAELEEILLEKIPLHFSKKSLH
jgi:16S rRNA A1518/A1519 N6-dimethyltransferase RsmA/KsgA/DIM1 with predicted DNA glycosylase/AP lyase activity